MIRRTPIKCSGSPIKRSGRPRKSNPKRRRSEFARTYHSEARVRFVQSLPCAACGFVGASQNAHLLGNGGLSRKAGFQTTGPLCGIRFGSPTVIGCHITYDKHRSVFDAAFPDFDPEKVAEQTEKLWLSRTLEDQ